MSIVLRICLIATAASGCASSRGATAPMVQRGSAHKTITKTIGYDYVAIIPQKRIAHEKLPLLIFLHGSGECGSDLSKVEKAILPQIAASRPDFPFGVIAPQSPSEKAWWEVESLDAMLDDVLKKYDVDEDRVYLTGLSMGGFAVWDWAAHRPERFAAIAPISGEPNTDLAEELVGLPVWAFHGGKDAEVSSHEDEKMVAKLTKLGGDAKLTIYPDAGHDAWTRTYKSDELFTWLGQHRRKK